MITSKRNPRLVKRAQDHIRYLVRTGKLNLPDVCYFCRKSGCTEYHHLDYSSADNVVRVHKSCHVAYHNVQRVEHYTVNRDTPNNFRIA